MQQDVLWMSFVLHLIEANLGPIISWLRILGGSEHIFLGDAEMSAQLQKSPSKSSSMSSIFQRADEEEWPEGTKYLVHTPNNDLIQQRSNTAVRII